MCEFEPTTGGTDQSRVVDKWDSGGFPTGDADLVERTRRLGRELVTYAGVANYPETSDRHPSRVPDCEADD